MKIPWDLKILWETGSRKAKILWDFVSQCEVCHVHYIILSPANALLLSDFRYAAIFGLAAMRSLKAFKAGIKSAFDQASGNWASVALKQWNNVRSTYVHLFPIANLKKI